MRLNAEQEMEFVLPKERLLLYTGVPLLYNKMTKEKIRLHSAQLRSGVQ